MKHKNLLSWMSIVIALLLVLLIAGIAPGQEADPNYPVPQGAGGGEGDSLELSGSVALAPDVALGSAFTYQGRLENGGSGYNGNCDFSFGLYSVISGGSPIGTQLVSNVTVTDGLFTVVLNNGNQFTSNAFDGNKRWLGIGVRCPASSGSWVGLSPRQELTAVPYALHAANVPKVNYAGGDQSVSLVQSPSVSVVRSVSITAPSAGQIIANASGYFFFTTGTGTDIARCSITNNPGIVFLDYLNIEEGNSTYSFGSFGATRVFPTGGGTSTIYLTCDKTTTGSVSVVDTNLNLIFYPSSAASPFSSGDNLVTTIDSQSSPGACPAADGCLP